MNSDSSRLMERIRDLAKLPRESEWVEFKENKFDPDDIGEYISALANSAALHAQPKAYLLWGIHDATHDLVGTTFRPRSEKVKGQELENWISTQLHPHIDFRINETAQGDKHFVIFEIPAAAHTPIRFKDWEYIRVGSYKKKLRDHPEKERTLWSILSRTSFEDGIALADATRDQVLEVLDYSHYFRLMKLPLPNGQDAILERLTKESLISSASDHHFHVTNIGAILFARNLSDFGRLARKALRVIIYRGSNRVETLKEMTGSKGYAVGFEGAIAYINDQLPQNEHIGQALRTSVQMYPEVAIRELVANALIHQDFSISGTGPTVELFEDRMEITNPGRPLIDPQRFIDEPPRSRNEGVASVMRRAGICEERGSGIVKVFSAVEDFHLPPPDLRAMTGSMVAVLLGPRDFSQMDRNERVRACFQHACLLYVSGRRMTNATLRQRLGIKDSNYPIASRVIRDAQDNNLIKPYGQGSESKRDASYLPFWA
jgi:predicted HTH transcriptional regulator